jgi:sensor histidine kinase YesM
MFTYNIVVDEDINLESIEIPPMMIQPYVENAIWHGLLHKSSPGRLDIAFRLENNLLICTVEDNGVGREQAALLKSKSATTRKSLGQKITADRLQILNEKMGAEGSITFDDMKDANGEASGTRVTIKIPVDN